MGDGVARINGNQAQSDQAITGSPAPGTSQGVPPPYPGPPICPPYNQQFGPVQPAPAAPIGPPYNQQFGPVQPAPAAPIGPPFYPQCGPLQAAPIGPPYNQQFGTMQAAPVSPPYNYNQQFGAVQAAPVGGYLNPNPPVAVVRNKVEVEVKVPEANVVVVEPPERDCYFYCFDCSRDFQWYDLRGKGLCWIFLLLLLWLTVGVVVAAFMVLGCVLACLSSSDD